MGLASKRRGGASSAETGSGSGAVRSAKGSSGRSKEKNSSSYRSSDGDRIDRGSSSKTDRDGIDGGRSHGSSRGGARSRIMARASAAKSSGTSSAAVDTMPDAPRRRRPLDPSLLARGMSARAVGARVASHLKLVSSEDIEKDLRHMEAYRAACVAYSQQFFSYINSDLVGQGVYGAIPIGPGVLSAAAGDYGGDPNRRHRAPDGGVAAPSMSMPVRIDPEEEKRLSILRKKVAASEAEREVLETEYMSLRAHYVNACHRLKRNRHLVDGQLELLRELVRRSGEVLALRRVRCAAARDVLRCLEYRAAHAFERRHSSESRYRADVECSDRMDVDEEAKHESNLAKVWTSIERQLRDAEDSCFDVSTPHDVLVAKGVDSKDNDEGMAKTKEDDGEMSGNSSITSQELKKKTGKSDSGRAQSSKKGGSTSDEGSVSKNASGGGRRHKDNGDTNGKTLDVNVIPWNSRMMAKAPHDVPLLLSLLSSAPDRTVAYGVDDILTNNETALCWVNKNVPTEHQPAMGEEAKELESLRQEAELLTKTLDVETKENREIQNKIIESRKRSDEMCAMMSMLRTETEAVLNRHNIILETPEARARARDLHKKAAEAAEAAAAAARAEARANKATAEVDKEGRDADEEDLEVEDDAELAEPEDELEEELDEDGEMIEKDGDGETVTAEDDISQDDEGEVHEDDDVDDDEDQMSLSDLKRNFKGHRTGTGESDSAEEGEIHEEGEVNGVHEGEDEEDEIDYDDDEEGEIHEEEHAQPLKEVIVRQDGDVNDREDMNDGDGDDHHNMGEYDDEEEEGEIREDGDDDEEWQRDETKESGLNGGDGTNYDDVDTGKSPRASSSTKEGKGTNDGRGVANAKDMKKAASRADATAMLMKMEAGNNDEDDEDYDHPAKSGHAHLSRLSDDMDRKAGDAAGALANLAGGTDRNGGASRLREEEDEEEEDDDDNEDLGDDGRAAIAIGSMKSSFANHKRSLDEEDEELVDNNGAAMDQDSDGYSHVKKRRQV